MKIKTISIRKTKKILNCQSFIYYITVIDLQLIAISSNIYTSLIVMNAFKTFNVDI